ncbi:hypothetical protein CCMA1212_002292 [Trichoderma ghanense]|uniref:Uncharacterized protein n=1 Tax=Trichoderma ghanense TaxID=65468 RepID=A0ABY2HGG0_9HYPO
MQVGGKRCYAVFRAPCSVPTKVQGIATAKRSQQRAKDSRAEQSRDRASRVVIVIAMGLTSGTRCLT